MKRYIPLAIFLLVVALAAVPLVSGKDPSVHESMLIGKTAPALPGVTPQGPAVVNFFASWCLTCRLEQKALARIGDVSKVPVYGVAYKDKPEPLGAWLTQYGNPFTAIARDDDGRTGIEWGLTGVPETFVIDRTGIVRRKYTGALDEDIVANELAALLEELKK